MFPKVFVIHVKVMAKGRITIPKAVRHVLGVSSGEQVTFIVEGERCPHGQFCRLQYADASAGKKIEERGF